MAKKSPGKKNADKKQPKPQNQLLNLLAASAASITLVISCCFAYLAIIELEGNNQARISRISQNIADNQAAIFNQALEQLRLRLAALAESPEFLAALEDGDQYAMDRYRQELARSFPEASSAKLIKLGPLGIAALKKNQVKLRNHIEKDMVRLASNGETVDPEAYLIDKQWLFSLSQAIKPADSKYASGAFLITLNGSYLHSLLNQIDPAMGKSTLLQQTKGSAKIIISAGLSEVIRLKRTATTTVPHWTIQFTPSEQLIAHNSLSTMTLWLMLAVTVVTTLTAFVFAYISLRKTIASNLEQLNKIAAPNKTAFTLPGFADASTAIYQQLASVKAQINNQAEPQNSPAEISDSAAGDAARLSADELPETIFRAYDIRGIADEELTDNVVAAIGQAIGSEALEQGQQTVIVAADGRHSSPRIKEAMIKGLLASGRDVIDIGMVPTPLMYFATHQLGTQSGVMITGSHNPAEYNGIKIVINGHALSGETIGSLRDRILDQQFSSGKGQLESQAIDQSYIDYIINDVAIAQPLKIVLDAGNGVAGAVAPQLFEELGCEVITLFCEVDGDFPNHHPDPTVEANLSDLKLAVAQQQADLGIAFDGDGDRLGVVTASGETVPADRLLMLLAQDVVSRNPGADVLFDVKCTRNLNNLISHYGGRPIMWKTGHSFMKQKMAETGALLGGEFSGHIFFKERWFGFDDGLYAAARLIEILSTTDPDLDAQLATFPQSIGTPEIKVESDEKAKFEVIAQLAKNGQFGDGKLTTLDGVRVDFADGWGLARASNTTPMLILRFEADTEDALARIQQLFKDQLSSIDNTLDFGF